MNYILYVFLYDFWPDALFGGIRRVVVYLPFTVMAIAAGLLQLAAWGLRLLLHGRSESDLRRADERWLSHDSAKRVT
jgi:hypothetical protein